MALTITVTESATNAVNGLIIVPVVVTGAQPKASQTATPKFVNATSSPFMDQSVTTTQTGSQVFGAITDGSNNNPVTADARTTILENFEDTVQAASYNAWRATALTTTPGATTLGFSLPTGDNAIYGALEILPNGSLTIDGSTPAPFTTNAAQTGTTASFTPPAGSLIVLLVGHCSSGVSPVPTITNTGGLTFSQAPGGTSWLSEAFGTAVGIFLADVPAGATGGASMRPQTGRSARKRRHGRQQIWPQTAAVTAATVSGDVSFTETATITAAATDTVLGAAAVAETATVTASGTSTLQAAATVAETATITAAATGTLGAAAAVAETATITAAATATELAAATLTGTVTITATITVGSATVNGDVSFTEAATVTAAATGIRQAAAAVTQTATVTATATGIRQAAAAVAGTATITAAGTSTLTAAAALPVAATITAALTTAVTIQNAVSHPTVTGQTPGNKTTGAVHGSKVGEAAAVTPAVTGQKPAATVTQTTTTAPAVSGG